MSSIPRASCPRRIPGLIDVVLEGSPTASFAEMSRLQAEAEAALRDDPDVTGVVAVLGVGTLNPTSNVAHLQLTLKPSDAPEGGRPAVAERVRAKLVAHPGRHGLSSSRSRTSRSPRRRAGRNISIR